jgi:hypothetical protein
MMNLRTVRLQTDICTRNFSNRNQKCYRLKQLTQLFILQKRLATIEHLTKIRTSVGSIFVSAEQNSGSSSDYLRTSTLRNHNV